MTSFMFLHGLDILSKNMKQPRNDQVAWRSCILSSGLQFYLPKWQQT